ncbi:MAG: DUF485 domain-containing protein, partial [Streptosporangiaceae bacterium]
RLTGCNLDAPQKEERAVSLTQSGRENVSGYQVVQASREFQTLRRRFQRFAIPVTASFLAWYFAFVITAVFAPGLMRIRVLGAVNVGLCFAALQFASTFGITMAYCHWARRQFDPLSERLRQRLTAVRDR